MNTWRILFTNIETEDEAVVVIIGIQTMTLTEAIMVAIEQANTIGMVLDGWAVDFIGTHHDGINIAQERLAAVN